MTKSSSSATSVALRTVPSIVAPIRETAQVDKMISYGADELYCGLMDRRWLEKYGAVCSSNRREWSWANFTDVDELKAAVESAHALGVPVHVALNAAYYPRQAYDDVMYLVDTIVGAGADSLIVADIPLLYHLVREGIGIELRMSTAGAVFNHEAAEFYRKLGISRIVLERQLTPAEIADIARRTSVPLEVFVMFRRCINVDGFCTFHHGADSLDLGHVACRLPYDFTLLSKDGTSAADTAQVMRKYAGGSGSPIHADGIMTGDLFQCGLCALWDLHHAGVGAVKVVGRAMPMSHLLQIGVSSVRTFLDLLRDEPEISRADFYSRARSYVASELPSSYARKCHAGNCYFPWVLEERHNG